LDDHGGGKGRFRPSRKDMEGKSGKKCCEGVLTLAKKEPYSLDTPLAVLMKLDNIPPESTHDPLRCGESALGQRYPGFPS
jgi:hypothetical protein